MLGITWTWIIGHGIIHAKYHQVETPVYGQRFHKAHDKRNNNPGFKYSISDVTFNMVVTKKDKLDTNINICLFYTFQHISSCKTVQHAKHLPMIIWDRWSYQNTNKTRSCIISLINSKKYICCNYFQ